jgi:hypothetical protein
MCQSHFRPVLSLHEASRKYIELSPNTLQFLTLQFHEKDLTLTLNLLRIWPILPLLGRILSQWLESAILFTIKYIPFNNSNWVETSEAYGQF